MLECPFCNRDNVDDAVQCRCGYFFNKEKYKEKQEIEDQIAVAQYEASHGNEWTKKVEQMAKNQGAESVVISAAIESEIAQLDTDEERSEFLETLGFPIQKLES